MVTCAGIIDSEFHESSSRSRRPESSIQTYGTTWLVPMTPIKALLRCLSTATLGDPLMGVAIYHRTGEAALRLAPKKEERSFLASSMKYICLQEL